MEMTFCGWAFSSHSIAGVQNFLGFPTELKDGKRFIINGVSIPPPTRCPFRSTCSCRCRKRYTQLAIVPKTERRREKETSACPMRSSVWLPARLDQTRDRSNILELSDSWKFVAPCRQRQREVLHNPFQSFPFPDIENSPAPSALLKVHLWWARARATLGKIQPP